MRHLCAEGHYVCMCVEVVSAKNVRPGLNREYHGAETVKHHEEVIEARRPGVLRGEQPRAVGAVHRVVQHGVQGGLQICQAGIRALHRERDLRGNIHTGCAFRDVTFLPQNDIYI